MSSTFKLCFLCLIAVLSLLLFIQKPYHIDDTLFVSAAHQVLANSAKPYDFQINWFGEPVSMWIATQNPPFASYLMAGLIRLGFTSETAQHAFFILVAIGCLIVGCRLAARFCSHPFWVVCMMFSAPAFFVSATNVMPDVLLLFFILAALECWMVADVPPSKEARGMFLVMTAIFTSLAVLTKYFGIILFLLIPILDWTLHGRIRRRLLVLVLPLFVFVLWNVYSYSQAGFFHFFGAAQYSTHAAWKNWIPNMGIAAAFLGGSFWFPMLMLPWCVKKLSRKNLLVAVSLLLILGGILWNQHFAKSSWLIVAEWVVMAASGIAMLIVVCHPERSRGISLRNVISMDRQTLFLWVWLIAVLFFTIFLNWTISVRALLPALFPLLILVARNFSPLPTDGHDESRPYNEVIKFVGTRFIAPVTGLALSILLATADFHHAEANRKTADEIAQEGAKSGVKIVFAGHWGLQWYMQQKGFGSLNYSASAGTYSNTQILFPVLNNTNVKPIPSHTKLIYRKRVPNNLGLACLSVADQAGFYSSQFGVLPFGIANGPVETFSLLAEP
jgi:4-amino-4-deoxy-L-arabinose transferase-like glycosyltransferase